MAAIVIPVLGAIGSGLGAEYFRRRYVDAGNEKSKIAQRQGEYARNVVPYETVRQNQMGPINNSRPFILSYTPSIKDGKSTADVVDLYPQELHAESKFVSKPEVAISIDAFRMYSAVTGGDAEDAARAIKVKPGIRVEEEKKHSIRFSPYPMGSWLVSDELTKSMTLAPDFSLAPLNRQSLKLVEEKHGGIIGVHKRLKKLGITAANLESSGIDRSTSMFRMERRTFGSRPLVLECRDYGNGNLVASSVSTDPEELASRSFAAEREQNSSSRFWNGFGGGSLGVGALGFATYTVYNIFAKKGQQSK